MEDYSDIVLHIHEGIARITINRPDRYNAFRARTCDELIDAFNKAGWDRSDRSVPCPAWQRIWWAGRRWWKA